MEDYKTIRLWKTIEDFEDSFDEASIRACKLFVVSWGSDDFEWLEINPYTNRKAVIFSQIHFINEEEREGGSKDAEDLAEVLTDWGFKTQVCEDFSFDEIKKHLIAGKTEVVHGEIQYLINEISIFLQFQRMITAEPTAFFSL